MFHSLAHAPAGCTIWSWIVSHVDGGDHHHCLLAGKWDWKQSQNSNLYPTLWLSVLKENSPFPTLSPPLRPRAALVETAQSNYLWV